MSQLTQINFLNKWFSFFTSPRSNDPITANDLRPLIQDIVDSCVFKSDNTGGGNGDTLYYNILTADELDEDNAVEITHSLNCLVPVVFVWNANGEMLGTLNYSQKTIDANTVELTFEDIPGAEETYKYLIVKKIDNITEILDYIESLYIDFMTATYEGEIYKRQPFGWNSFTTLYDGTVEDHLGEHTNHNDDSSEYGINVVNEDTGTRYWLVLQNKTRYVEAGETYRIQMSGINNASQGMTCNMDICGNTVQFDAWIFSIDVEITATSAALFYFKTDSNDDINFWIYNLRVTKL